MSATSKINKKVLASALSLAMFFGAGMAVVHAACPPDCASSNSGGNPSTGGGNPSTGGGNPSTGGGASAPDQNIGIKIPNPLSSGDSLFELLSTIIDKILLPIGGILAVLAFIYSGFLYVTAQGNERKIETANRALLYSAIGTAVLLGAWAIAKVICGTLVQIGAPSCGF